MAGAHVHVVGNGGGGRGGSGSLNSLDEPRNPKVTHGVLELLAVDITFKLFGVLLNPSSPVIFDLIVCPSRQVLSNFRPPKHPNRIQN